MNIEGIDIKDIEFGEPIEEREPNYRDGYIRGIYRAKNIIDSKQKEIERLNNIINELEKWLEDDNILIFDFTGSINKSEGTLISDEEISKKIEELKGSDKE